MSSSVSSAMNVSDPPRGLPRIFSLYFDDWNHDRTLPPNSFDIITAISSSGHLLTPLQMLFVAVVAADKGDCSTAASYYHSAFNEDVTLRHTCEFDDLEVVCENGAASGLTEMLGNPGGITEIACASQISWHETSARLEALNAAKRARIEPPSRQHCRCLRIQSPAT